MATGASEAGGFLILLSAVLLFFAWWSWRLRKGIRIRPWWVILFGLFYVVVFLSVEADVLRLPWGGLGRAAAVLDFWLLIFGMIPAYLYTARTTTFEHPSNRSWVYRGRLVIPTVWLAVFLLRFGVELALLGHVYLFSPSVSSAVAIPSFAAALIVVDMLFAISTGLVLGDSLAIYLIYRQERERRAVPEGASLSAKAGTRATTQDDRPHNL